LPSAGTQTASKLLVVLDGTDATGRAVHTDVYTFALHRCSFFHSQTADWEATLAAAVGDGEEMVRLLPSAAAAAAILCLLVCTHCALLGLFGTYTCNHALAATEL
jgi:hypothetical protein